MKIKIKDETYTIINISGNDCTVKNERGHKIAGTINQINKTIQLMGWLRAIKYTLIDL